MRLEIKITTSDVEIRKRILKECLAVIKPKIDKIHRVLSIFLPDYITGKITDSETWQSLISGPLRAELGLENPQALLALVAKHIESEIFVSKPKFSTSIDHLSEIGLGGIPSDYETLMNSPGASYISINSQGNRTPIHWLRYLLTAGKAPIFRNTVIRRYSSPIKAGRTKMALMRKSAGGVYILPGAGTLNNNFLKKTIKSLENELIQVIVYAYLREFGQ